MLQVRTKSVERRSNLSFVLIKCALLLGRVRIRQNHLLVPVNSVYS